MKDKFAAYKALTKDELENLWQNAYFIFDTNVLTNFYRYQSSTVNDLANLIGHLEERVWLPYHVGLEFYRNRKKVIADQHCLFKKVQDTVNDSIGGLENGLNKLQLVNRHSQIEPEKFLRDVKELRDKFISELSELEKLSVNVNSPDPILDKIETLFEGKIGDPPKSKDEIKEIMKEGIERYKFRFPPGFEDDNKNKNEERYFSYGGILYEKQYGDLIIWKQIIDFAKTENLTDIIFVTDDNKLDWWWKEKDNGLKTLGPRPELREELLREANVARFHMYGTEGFLKNSNLYLDIQISNQSVKDIQEVNKPKLGLPLKMLAGRSMYEKISLTSFQKWIKETGYSQYSFEEDLFYGFTVYAGGKKLGFAIEYLNFNSSQHYIDVIEQFYLRAMRLISQHDFSELNLTLVIQNPIMIDVLNIETEWDKLKRAVTELPTYKAMKLIIGKYSTDDNSVYFGYLH